MQIERPLDFIAVTDHSELLGERELRINPDSPEYTNKFCVAYREAEFRGTLMLASVLSMKVPQRIEMLCGTDGSLCRDSAQLPWQMILQAAEDAYDRSAECSFTSFIGYEYTVTPGTSSYHRNVIFRNNSVPLLPVSYIEANGNHAMGATQ